MALIQQTKIAVTEFLLLLIISMALDRYLEGLDIHFSLLDIKNLLVVSKSSLKHFLQFFEIWWSTFNITDDFQNVFFSVLVIHIKQ